MEGGDIGLDFMHVFAVHLVQRLEDVLAVLAAEQRTLMANGAMTRATKHGELFAVLVTSEGRNELILSNRYQRCFSQQTNLKKNINCNVLNEPDGPSLTHRLCPSPPPCQPLSNKSGGCPAAVSLRPPSGNSPADAGAVWSDNVGTENVVAPSASAEKKQREHIRITKTDSLNHKS